jgi:hypothetical protein
VAFVRLLGAPPGRERALASRAYLVLDLRASSRVHRTLLDGLVAHDKYDGHDSDYSYGRSYE